MTKGAEFSEDKKYRYVLWRIWDDSKKVALCIGLNPSKAGEEKNDNTINILIAALTALGYGGLRMVNLYSLISTQPAALHNCADPLKGNDSWIMANAMFSQEVIFCWGNFKRIESRVKAMTDMFPDALCFGKNANGSPWHPRAITYAGIRPVEAKLQRYGKRTG